ncbi:hypothetical protein QUB63_24235 [Microcoleus sp. ARI1-B5]|uniref:hypothetical protein n=1 Tax=unclassified Microcoleus TaxID=2642155 RepID=UPI002FD42FD1
MNCLSIDELVMVKPLPDRQCKPDRPQAIANHANITVPESRIELKVDRTQIQSKSPLFR